MIKRKIVYRYFVLIGILLIGIPITYSTSATSLEQEVPILFEPQENDDLIPQFLEIKENEYIELMQDPLTFDIFGYSLKIDKNEIIRDEKAFMSLKLNSQSSTNISVDIDMKLKFGEFKYTKLIAECDLFVGELGQNIFQYTLDSPVDGFFMEMDIFPHETHISLAFDGGEEQFIYDGVNSFGSQDVNCLFSEKMTIYEIEEEVAIIDFKSGLSLEGYAEEKRESQQTDLTILKSSQTSAPSAASPGSFYTTYGIVHNVADADERIYFTNNIHPLMDDHANVDIAFSRHEPSESLIKSDLQVYNKDYYPDEWTYQKRDILAYLPLTHGVSYNSHWQMDGWLQWLKASEVEDLWTSSSIHETSADGMIIFNINCYGLDDYDMRDAFMDNDAKNFIGCFIEVKVYTLSVRSFWYHLTNWDEDVEFGLDQFIENFNSHWGSEYYYDGSWEIAGSASNTL